MVEILSIAIAVTLFTSVFICLKWRNLPCKGETPLSLVAFAAILFTSGLDVGLIMFPLVEFQFTLQRKPIASLTHWRLNLVFGVF